MQFVIFLFHLTSLAGAKTDFCRFSSDFAEKYLEARTNYAHNLVDKRNYARLSDVSSGKFRVMEHGKKWSEVSLKKAVNKLFRTNDIEIKVKENGKMLVYPKKVKDGDPVILFDSSGDYFRIAKAVVKNGTVKDTASYFDINGKPLELPPRNAGPEKLDEYSALTHFRAMP